MANLVSLYGDGGGRPFSGEGNNPAASSCADPARHERLTAQWVPVNTCASQLMFALFESVKLDSVLTTTEVTNVEWVI